MTHLGSIGLTQSRAIIIAALIGVVGAVVAALVGGREWGEQRAASDTSLLESRLQRQEQALQALQIQLAAKDATIHSLTDKLQQQRALDQPQQRALDQPPTRSAAPAVGQPTSVGSVQDPVVPAANTPREPVPEAPVATESNAGLEVSLLGCTATGTAVTCDMRVTNTRADRRMRLGAGSGSRLIDKQGNEAWASAASIGATKWTIGFAENNLAEATPTRAALYFDDVPISAREASLLQVTFAEGRASFDIKFRNVPIDRN